MDKTSWTYITYCKFKLLKQYVLQRTECPKIYRKSVLHLLKYNLCCTLSDAVQICGKFWDTQYILDKNFYGNIESTVCSMY